MCYEYEWLYLRQRAEDARQALEDERKRAEKPEKESGDKAPTQPEPVPV